MEMLTVEPSEELSERDEEVPLGLELFECREEDALTLQAKCRTTDVESAPSETQREHRFD